MKNFIIIICFIAFFGSCQNNNAVKEAAQAEVEAAATQIEENKQKVEELKSQILEEDDYFGRMERGLASLNTQYQLSQDAMPTLGNVTVELSDDLELTIKNELNGDVFETKANLLDLNSADGGFRLIPDEKPGEFPGFRVKTKNDEAKVFIFKNGDLVNKNNELIIYLKDRDIVGKAVPAMLQTLRIAEEMKANE